MRAVWPEDRAATGRPRPGLPGKFAPGYEDLRVAATAEVVGNRSFLFAQAEHPWHMVRPLQDTQRMYRRVFIAIPNHFCIQVLSRRLREKDPDGYHL